MEILWSNLFYAFLMCITPLDIPDKYYTQMIFIEYREIVFLKKKIIEKGLYVFMS